SAFNVAPSLKSEIIDFTRAGTGTATLKLDPGTVSGVMKYFTNNGTGDLTLAMDSGITINGSGSSIIIKPACSLQIVSSMANTWKIVGGLKKSEALTAPVPTAPSATYVQAELVSTNTRLADLITKLQNAGILKT